MNDHNLDDLIIDNIDPKNSKTKSFLTIIALAIVVLIVAIILTKTILKDPQQQAILEEDDTELISPDLTLQDTPKEVTTPKAPEKVEHIKEEIALGTKETSSENEKAQVQTTEVAPKASKRDTQKAEKAKALELKRKKEKEAIAAKEKAKAKEALASKKEEAKSKKEEETKKVSANAKGYFIQVGSFSQTPSARFLTVIKNSGFAYHVTPTSSGIKKLLIGPYSSREEANTALVRVKDRINKSAFVIKK